jgi:phosphatidylinositol alpha-1,6-mannosyltransferase
VHDAGHEINVDGKTGYNVDLRQPSQLAARLIELLAAPQLRRRMGEAGRARWRQHFRYSAFRDRLMPLLGCIAGASRA